MQALVKTPRTNIHIQGDIPEKILKALKEEYGNLLRITDDDDDEKRIDIFQSDWYREMDSQITPGDALRTYRVNHGLTQAQLGVKLGNKPRQIISNMERGVRTISLKTAKKLAFLFNVPVDRFLDLEHPHTSE